MKIVYNIEFMIKQNVYTTNDRMLPNLSGDIKEYKDFSLPQQMTPVSFSELYISGLIKTERGKRNIERIHEELDMLGDGYQQSQQFITDSPGCLKQILKREFVLVGLVETDFTCPFGKPV